MFFDVLPFDALDRYCFPSFTMVSTLTRAAHRHLAIASFGVCSPLPRTLYGASLDKSLQRGTSLLHREIRQTCIELVYQDHTGPKAKILRYCKLHKLRQSSHRVFNPSTRGIIAKPKPATLSICQKSKTPFPPKLPDIPRQAHSPHVTLKVYNHPPTYPASTPCPDSSSCSSQSHPQHPPPSLPLP